MPRKGRGNAILTYETVAEIKEGLVKLTEQLSAIGEKLQVRTEAHQDHEVRLRVLERDTNALSISRSSTKDVYLWVFGALVSVGQVALAVLAYLK